MQAVANTELRWPENALAKGVGRLESLVRDCCERLTVARERKGRRVEGSGFWAHIVYSSGLRV